MNSIDVVVPCYQYGQFLHDCVASILAQDRVHLRVLIIDNASTDGSLEIAQELARKDPRVEIEGHKTNRGASASYNEGIDWASADYFHLLDADDVLVPGSLARAVACMERNRNVVMTHGGESQVAFEAGATPVVPLPPSVEWIVTRGHDFIDGLCRRPVNNVGATTVVRRTSAQKQAGYYRAELPFTDDLELWLRLATIGDIASTTTVQAIRRIHKAQATNSFVEFIVPDIVEREAAFSSFFMHEGRYLPAAKHLHRRARQRLADQAYWWGLSRTFHGDLPAGWALLRYAFANSPLSLVLPPLSYIFRKDSRLRRLAGICRDALVERSHVGQLHKAHKLESTRTK